MDPREDQSLLRAILSGWPRRVRPARRVGKGALPRRAHVKSLRGLKRCAWAWRTQRGALIEILRPPLPTLLLRFMSRWPDKSGLEATARRVGKGALGRRAYAKSFIRLKRCAWARRTQRGALIEILRPPLPTLLLRFMSRWPNKSGHEATARRVGKGALGRRAHAKSFIRLKRCAWARRTQRGALIEILRPPLPTLLLRFMSKWPNKSGHEATARRVGKGALPRRAHVKSLRGLKRCAWARRTQRGALIEILRPPLPTLLLTSRTFPAPQKIEAAENKCDNEQQQIFVGGAQFRVHRVKPY